MAAIDDLNALVLRSQQIADRVVEELNKPHVTDDQVIAAVASINSNFNRIDAALPPITPTP